MGEYECIEPFELMMYSYGESVHMYRRSVERGDRFTLVSYDPFNIRGEVHMVGERFNIRINEDTLMENFKEVRDDDGNGNAQ